LFNEYAGICRFVWNKFLALNLKRLADRQLILRFYEMSFWVTLWKKSDEYSFLKICPRQLLTNKLRDMDKAFRLAFDKSRPSMHIPKFKKKFQCERLQFTQNIKVSHDQVYLTGIGWLKFRKSRDIVGTPNCIHVSRKGKHWYVSIQTIYEKSTPIHSSKSMVGIDVGVVNFITLSTGETVKSISAYKHNKTALAKAQRDLARKVKRSNNYYKQILVIQKLHEKIANTRKDFIHKCTNNISKNHAIVVLEDLRIRNMTRSATGTLEKPGSNVQAKKGLNRSILDQGWAELGRQLEYKQHQAGGEVLYVDARYTSQTCPNCLHVSADNRKSRNAFVCVECNHNGPADVVAAVNIKRAGHARLACGDIDSVRGRAQEPLLAAYALN
jgi:putative transposase